MDAFLYSQFEQVCLLDGPKLDEMLVTNLGLARYREDKKLVNDIVTLYELDADRYCAGIVLASANEEHPSCPGVADAVICSSCPYYFNSKASGNKEIVQSIMR